MSRRVSPTEKIRSEIDALFDGERDLAATIEDVARIGARLLLQTALEAEIDEFLGRSRYPSIVRWSGRASGTRGLLLQQQNSTAWRGMFPALRQAAGGAGEYPPHRAAPRLILAL